MEYLSPEEIRLRKLLKLNKFLKVLLAIVLLLLLIFLVKHALIAAKSIEQSGVPLNSVIDIIKYYFTAFFESFSELVSKYLLFMSLIILIYAVGLTANMLLKVFQSRIFYTMYFIICVAIVFMLPIDPIHTAVLRTGKTWAFLFYLMMLVPMPYGISRYMARDAITAMVAGKILYIVIYSLLLVQFVLE